MPTKEQLVAWAYMSVLSQGQVIKHRTGGWQAQGGLCALTAWLWLTRSAGPQGRPPGRDGPVFSQR